MLHRFKTDALDIHPSEGERRNNRTVMRLENSGNSEVVRTRDASKDAQSGYVGITEKPLAGNRIKLDFPISDRSGKIRKLLS